jgi:hypothetical protein
MLAEGGTHSINHDKRRLAARQAPGRRTRMPPRRAGDRRNPASPVGRGIAFTIIVVLLVDAEADSTQAAIDKLEAGPRAMFPFCFT